MGEILTLGAGRVTDAEGNQIPPVVRGLMEGSDDPDDAADEGEVPFMCALGVTALPAPKDDTGHAEGNFEPVPCYGSACVGARDTRCSDVYGKLKAGQTAVYNTGGDATKRSRTFYKEDSCTTIVGNNIILSLDRANSKISIAGMGHVFEMSTEQGIMMIPKGGKCGIQLTESGDVYIWGKSVNLGGRTVPGNPATAVIMGVSGMTGIPATSVFITL